MTKLRGFDITDSLETCIDGLKAFRNGREWAKEQRDSFIETANARARECAEAPSTQKDNATQSQQNEGSSPKEFVDCDESVESQEHGGPSLQQDPINYNDYDTS